MGEEDRARQMESLRDQDDRLVGMTVPKVGNRVDRPSGIAIQIDRVRFDVGLEKGSSQLVGLVQAIPIQTARAEDATGSVPMKGRRGRRDAGHEERARATVPSSGSASEHDDPRPVVDLLQ